jgi:hypothetical protein
MQYLHTVLPSSVGVTIKKSGVRALLRCTVVPAVSIQLAALELPGEVTFFYRQGRLSHLYSVWGGHLARRLSFPALLERHLFDLLRRFTVILRVVGFNYRIEPLATARGVLFSLGWGCSIPFMVPPQFAFVIGGGDTLLYLTGYSYRAIRNLGFMVRSLRPFNIYTGKGIGFKEESTRLKPGKEEYQK